MRQSSVSTAGQEKPGVLGNTHLVIQQLLNAAHSIPAGLDLLQAHLWSGQPHIFCVPSRSLCTARSQAAQAIASCTVSTGDRPSEGAWPSAHRGRMYRKAGYSRCAPTFTGHHVGHRSPREAAVRAQTAHEAPGSRSPLRGPFAKWVAARRVGLVPRTRRKVDYAVCFRGALAEPLAVGALVFVALVRPVDVPV